MECYVTRNRNGSFEISTIIDNQRYHRQFYGYSLKVAKRLFKHWLSNSGLI